MRATAPPCEEDDTRGEFDADLVLADRPTEMPSGPFAFGSAHVRYELVHEEHACTTGGFGSLHYGL